MRKFLFIIFLSTLLLSICLGDDPIAYDETYVLDEDTGININLSATDADGDALSFNIVSEPINGMIVLLGNGLVTYYPNENFNGEDYFEFIVSDGESNSNIATITLIVIPINDAPYIDNIQDAVVDSGAIFTTTIVVYDVDGDELSFSASADNSYVSLDQNTLTIIPADDFSGMINVVVTVSDGMMTDTTQFTITVLPYEENTLGDINGDGEINVVDVVVIVGNILNGSEYNSLADLNQDGVINVVDVVLLVNWILYGMPEENSPIGLWKAVVRFDTDLNTGEVDTTSYIYETVDYLLSFIDNEYNDYIDFSPNGFYYFTNTQLSYTADSLFLNPNLDVNGWYSVIDESVDEFSCSLINYSDMFLRARYELTDNNLIMYYLGGEDNEYNIKLILTNDYEDVIITRCTNANYLNYNPLSNYDSGFCNNIECNWDSTQVRIPLNKLQLFNK